MPKPNLNNFGKKLKLTKRSEEKVITEKEIFIETINLFFDVWNRSNRVYDSYQVNLLEYEEPFYQIIENCLILKYEPWKVEIILWYIFAREDVDGNILPLQLHIEDKEEEQVMLTSPEELWEFIKRIDKEDNKNEN